MRKILLEQESITMYLHTAEISTVKSDVEVLADIGVSPDNHYQVVAFDVYGNIYKAEKETDRDVYNVIKSPEDIEILSYIFRKFERVKRELYDALEYMEHTENELNKMKETLKFITVAYINAYIKNGALLKECSADVALLESLNITDVLDSLSNLFNITKEPILNSQKIYNKYHSEHFILLEIYKRLSESYGINKIPYIVAIDEYKHRDSVYIINTIHHTASRFEGIEECEEVYNYYKNRAVELEGSYTKAREQTDVKKYSINYNNVFSIDMTGTLEEAKKIALEHAGHSRQPICIHDSITGEEVAFSHWHRVNESDIGKCGAGLTTGKREYYAEWREVNGAGQVQMDVSTPSSKL